MYKCVMVVTLLYTCTGTEIGTKIGIKIGRYGDMEIWSRNGKIQPICLFVWVVWSLSLVGLLWFGSLWFTLVWFGSDF